MNIYQKVAQERKWVEPLFKNRLIVRGNSHLISHINQTDEWLQIRLSNHEAASTFLGDSLEIQDALYDILANDTFIDLVCEEIISKNEETKLDKLNTRTMLEINIELSREDWEDFTDIPYPKTKKYFWDKDENGKSFKNVMEELETVRFGFNFNSNREFIMLKTTFPK